MEGCECGRDKSGSELVRICIGRKRIQTGFELVRHFASVDKPYETIHIIHLWEFSYRFWVSFRIL